MLINIISYKRFTPLCVALALHLLLFFFLFDKRDVPVENMSNERMVLIFSVKKNVVFSIPEKKQKTAMTRQTAAKMQKKKLAIVVEHKIETMPTAPPEEFENVVTPKRSVADILAQAKRDVKNIDKEFRAERSLIPNQEREIWETALSKGFAAAYVGHSQEIIDFYRSPDGTVYSRKTTGGKVRCTMSSGLSNISDALKSGGRGTIQVNCPPKNYAWKNSPG